MNAQPSSDSGFSLVETLVAVFIVALISAGAAVMLTQTVQAGKQVSERAGELSEIQIANALMRDDFSSITRRASMSPDAFAQLDVFTGNSANSNSEILIFSRNAWGQMPGGAPRSDLQRVTYRFENGDLIRKAWMRPDPDRQTQFTERVLLSGITDLSVRYAKDGFWEEEWRLRTSDQDEVLLPDAVEIIGKFRDGDELRQVFATGGRS